jgi:uncharacterized membrane protein
MRKLFLAGLLFWLPIWATFVVIRFLVGILDGSLAMLPHQYRPETLFGIHIPGLGLIFTIGILFLTGIFVTNFLGNKLVKLWDKIVARIPIIRSIYSAVKQVLDAFVKPTNESFSKVLLLEFPRKGIWSIGFQTSGGFQPVPEVGDMLTVFIPLTPNPTSGHVMLMPKEDVVELNMTIEEAFKMIISLGVITPSPTQSMPKTHSDEQKIG